MSLNKHRNKFLECIIQVYKLIVSMSYVRDMIKYMDQPSAAWLNRENVNNTYSRRCSDLSVLALKKKNKKKGTLLNY